MSDFCLQMDGSSANKSTSGHIGQLPQRLVLVEDVTKPFGYKMVLEHVSFDVPPAGLATRLRMTGIQLCTKSVAIERFNRRITCVD